MIRGLNSNQVDENVANASRSKEGRLGVATPRRAFGQLSANTPRSTIKSAKAESLHRNVLVAGAMSPLVKCNNVSQTVPKTPVLFEDSFDAMCNKNKGAELSPWKEYPPVERAMPPSPVALCGPIEDTEEDVLLRNEEVEEEPIESFPKFCDWEDIEDYLPKSEERDLILVKPEIPDNYVILNPDYVDSDCSMDSEEWEELVARLPPSFEDYVPQEPVPGLTTFVELEELEPERLVPIPEEEETDDEWDAIMKTVQSGSFDPGF